MAYRLRITENAAGQIDRLADYLAVKLHNPGAAGKFMDELAAVYDRMEENPYQFPESADGYLQKRGYREALLPGLHYRAVFRIEDGTVYVVGVFHVLEEHTEKLP